MESLEIVLYTLRLWPVDGFMHNYDIIRGKQSATNANLLGETRSSKKGFIRATKIFDTIL